MDTPIEQWNWNFLLTEARRVGVKASYHDKKVNIIKEMQKVSGIFIDEKASIPGSSIRTKTLYGTDRNGTQIENRPDGKFTTTTDWVNGQKHGIRVWSINGRTCLRQSYIKDKLHGLSIEFNHELYYYEGVQVTKETFEELSAS